LLVSIIIRILQSSMLNLVLMLIVRIGRLTHSCLLTHAYSLILTHLFRLERTPLHVICSIPEDRVDLASYIIKNGADDRKMDVHG
jgi:hypothetical protein